MSSDFNFISIIWFIVILIISALGFIGCFWLYRYNRLSVDNECCKERHCIIIDVFQLIGAFSICIKTSIDVHMGSYDMVTILISLLLSSIIIVSATVIEAKYAGHLYMLLYESEFSKSIQNYEWHTVIDNTLTGNWFVKNKMKWGNRHYINKITWIYVLITGPSQIIVYCIVFMDTHNIKMIHTRVSLYMRILKAILVIVHVIPVSVILILSRKLKHFNDVFLISKQFGYNVRVTLLGCTLVITGNIVKLLMDHYPGYIIYSFIAGVLGIALIEIISVYINTYWVIKYVIDVYTQNNQRSITESRSASFTIKQILNNSKSINYFMVHLSKEISTEILLSYFEMRQYEIYAMKTFGISKNDGILREFPDVPLSCLVTKYKNITAMSNERKCKHIIYDIYTKYIHEYSPYSINISYDARNKLDNLLSDKEIWLNINIEIDELIAVYSQCCREMYRLLHNSFLRLCHDSESTAIMSQYFNV